MVVNRSGVGYDAFGHHINDGAMSPRSIQSGLTKYGIELSQSTYHARQQDPAITSTNKNNNKHMMMMPPPLSPLDKARMQWKTHKHRVVAETREPGDAAPSSEEEPIRPEPSRSRSMSPERCQMYGDRARGDHRSFGLVGDPIEAVVLKPVPKSRRVVRGSKSSIRSSRRSKSGRSSRYHETRDNRDRSRSSSRASTRRNETATDAQREQSECSNFFENIAASASQAFEDISKSFDEADERKRQAIDVLSAEVKKTMPPPPIATADKGAKTNKEESGYSNLFEDIAVNASQTFDKISTSFDISKSFEEAEEWKRQAVNLLSDEVKKAMPPPTPKAEVDAKPNKGNSNKMTLAASFASLESGSKNIKPNEPGASLTSIFCGMDVLQGLCGSAPNESDSTVSSMGFQSAHQANEKKKQRDSLFNCAGRCATSQGITSLNTLSLDGDAIFSIGDNEDFTLSDDEAEANTKDEQNLFLRETFSFLSASLPEVGWKVNVDSNNRRLVQRRTGAFGHTPQATEGTYKVAILDDRTTGSSASIKIATVKRDPSLLSRCHFAGWDGKRSHYTVLTSPPTTDPDAAKGILGKLKEVPGTLSFTHASSPSNYASKMPTWLQPEVLRKLEGTDAVVHLVVGPEQPKDDAEKKESESKDSNGDEEKMLNKIVTGWRALSFSDDEDGDEVDNDEESYAPSTVGPVEDKLLRNFLGSADWNEMDFASESKITDAAAATPSAEDPQQSPIGVGAKPPLGPPPNHLPTNLPRVKKNTSRLSTGSFHRRNNSIGLFTDGQISQIVGPKSPNSSSVLPTCMPVHPKEDKTNIPSKKMTKGKMVPSLAFSSRPRRQKVDKKSAKKSKLAIWRKRNAPGVPSSGSCVSSTLNRTAEPKRRENSIILKASASFEQGLIHSPQEFLTKCPMFRRALRSMGNCGKRERPRLEGWVAFSKGNALQTYGPLRDFCRDDFRYIVLTNCDGPPTIHIMTSKRESSDTSVDGIERLVLTKNMRATSSETSNGSRCLSIVDSRNGKVIGTFMPVLIKKNLFTDGSQSSLVSENRFQKIISGYESTDTSATESLALVLDGQQEAANHALFVVDCELKRSS